MRAGKKFKNVDEYMSELPPNSKIILEGLRKAIKQVAPKAEEVISYNMPALKFNGVLVFYAAYKDHIGFYPTAAGITAFKKELSKYDIAKGTVRFSVDERLPLSLIKEIVKFRVIQNVEKAKSKLAKKK